MGAKKVKGTKQTFVQKEEVKKTKSFWVKPVKCLNERQKEFQNSIKEKEVTLCTGVAGVGKTFLALYNALKMLEEGYEKIILCKSVITVDEEAIGFIPGPQPLDTNVVTPNGWKRFGDLKIGDEVISRDGFPTKVLNIYPKGKKQVYKITLADGRTTEACGDHVWATYDSHKTYEQLVSTKYMFDNIESKKFYLPLAAASQYDDIEVPIDAYLIGVMIGDGMISGSHTRFCSNDQEIVDNITKIIEPFGVSLTKKDLIYTISNGRDNTKAGAREMARKNLLTNEIEILGYLKEATSKLNIKDTTLIGRCTKNSIVDNYQYFFTGNISKSSNPIRQILVDLDLAEKKSFEKRIPSLYLYSSLESRISLLQGLLDTDGTIKKEGKDLIYYTTSEGLADDIVELVYSLGGTARKHSRNRIGNIQEYESGNIECKRICYEIYINLYNNLFNPFRLSRKAERFKPKTTPHYSTKVSKIEKLGFKEVQCIKVDNPEHLYLTDNFIVTHNTIEEKMSPFMMSYKGNLNKLIGEKECEAMFKEKIIEVLPLAYIRGINIDNSIVILDETQNLNVNTFKSIITRIGTNSKYIIMGDTEQIDMKDKNKSALAKVIELFKDSDLVGTVQFTDEDCVRNPIIPYLLDKIKEIEK